MRSQRSRDILLSISLTRRGERGEGKKRQNNHRAIKEGERSIVVILVVTAIVTRIITTIETTTIVKAHNLPSGCSLPCSIAIFH
jgi:hypothetical protein